MIFFLCVRVLCICVRLGQRDKPFVSESEHELRTPRPDLLDRPYAPDYSGESFRNQYKVNNRAFFPSSKHRSHS